MVISRNGTPICFSASQGRNDHEEEALLPMTRVRSLILSAGFFWIDDCAGDYLLAGHSESTPLNTRFGLFTLQAFQRQPGRPCWMQAMLDIARHRTRHE